MALSKSTIFFVTIWLTMIVSICPVNGGQSFCSKQIDQGPCKAALPSWGYQPITEECVEFIYGGCKGNENRFESKEACKEACHESTSSSEAKKLHVCLKPKDIGTCQTQNVTKWAYNCANRDCEEFTYGGCGGNDNKFDSLELCEKTCQHSFSCMSIEPIAAPGIPKRSRRGAQKKSKQPKKVTPPSSEDASEDKDDNTSYSSSISASHEMYSASGEESSSEEKVNSSEEGGSRKKTKRTRKLQTKRKAYQSHREETKRSRSYF